MKYLKPIQKHGKSKRGSTLCLSWLQAQVWIITSVSKGAAVFWCKMCFLSNKVWEVWKVCWPWNEPGDFIYGNWSHSPPFTTGGHRYSRLCWLVAIKDFKDRAVDALALQLTTWPSNAPLVESCNRKWTKDYSEHSQSGDEKGLCTRGY